MWFGHKGICELCNREVAPVVTFGAKGQPTICEPCLAEKVFGRKFEEHPKGRAYREKRDSKAQGQ